MENLSHSKLKLPKKPTSHNAAAATNSGPLHKSIYDDVFGGPPKMGVPTFLSPRVEDYGEIFGGFHAPRASGIPVLDLPVTEEDEVDIGNGRLDYKEVFGGFAGLDFANGYEELVRELSHGGGSFSDAVEDEDDEVDEAWTPAGSSDCLSEVSDHSGSNQCVSNGGSCQSFDGNIEYNIYYHKSNPGTDMDTANGIRHTVPTHSVRGFSYVVDQSNSFQRSGKENLASQRPDHDNLEMDYGHETIKKKHLRKTTSHPLYSNVYGQEYGVDIRAQKEYGRINSFPNETFVTISEVSLRTDPTHLPPPSRLPPALDGKGGDGGRLASKWKVEPLEENNCESSPAFFDVEVDVGSSGAASAPAAAIKEAMEKAQAKIKSAKELMERKKEGLQAQTKEALTNDFKDTGGKGNKIASGMKSVNNEVVTRGPWRIESNSMGNPYTLELQKVTKIELDNLDIDGGEKMPKDLKGPSGGDRGKHMSSSQIFGDYEETDEWKEASQFFELVKADKLRGPVELGKKEKVFLQNGKDNSHAGKEGIVSRETFDRQEYDYTTKATSSHGAEIIGEKENYECTNKGRLKAVKEASKQKQGNTAHKILEPEGTGKKYKVPSSPEGIHEKLEKDVYSGNDSLDDIQIEVDGFEIRHVKAHKDDRKDMNEVSSKAETIVKHATEQKHARQNVNDIDKRTHYKDNIKDCCSMESEKERDEEVLEWEEKERRLDAAFKQAENENRQRGMLETEENKRGPEMIVEKQEKKNKKVDSFEREENGKRSQRLGEQKENEKKLVEVSQLKEQKRSREVSECEENNRREKEAYLQVDRKMKETHEKEEVETRLPERKENMLKQAVQQNKAQREEVEKIFEESHMQENYDNVVREAYNREVNEKRFEESQESQKKENSQKEATKQDEIHERNRETTEESNVTFVKGVEWEEIDWELQDETVLEEIGDKVYEDSNVRGLNDMNEANKQSQKDDFQGRADNNDNISGAGISEENSRRKESTGEVFVNERNDTVCTGAELNGKNSAKAVTGYLRDNTNQVYGLSEGELKGIKNQIKVESAQEPLLSYTKSGETAVFKEQTNIKTARKASPARPQNVERKSAPEVGEIEKKSNQTRIPLNQNEKEKFASPRLVKEEFDKGEEKETTQPAIANSRKTSQQQNVTAAEGRQEKMGLTKSEDKKTQKLKREEELENERLRKLEEEREREREREKDRMAVDRATLEAQERSYAEARERAERAAIEKATADARQRAMAEARERLEKACAEARERSFGDKASAEARLRAERAAVERATAEARERAAEKAASSRYGGMRPSSSNVQDRQYQNAGSSDSSRYQYSLGSSGSSINERSEGVEGESAQRCRARLERHRRMAERAAKALAEKNMRDLIAQREQAERNRLAETLDADVKRWSSGKEGNLRALLSTLQYILGPDSGWQPIPLTEVITSAAVKKAYRKATLCVHPDKLQQRGASIQQKYICEKVFDLLKEAWNKFNSEER